MFAAVQSGKERVTLDQSGKGDEPGSDSAMSSNTLFSVLMSFMLQTLFILLISFCSDSCSFSIPLCEIMTHMSSVCSLCWEIKPDQ